jgi:hypothetical protein
MGSPSSQLIEGQYALHVAQPLAGGGGQAAFAASGPNGTAFMAVEVSRSLPARPRALRTLCAEPVAGMINPVAHGPGPSPRGGGQEYFVVCQRPPGPSLEAAPRSWTEAELIGCVLLPAAHALDRLGASGLTHRGIRADNVFQAAPGEPVVLGQAWAAPPAALQPALMEPPYSAMCLPAGRGEGGIADDVYALGVLLVILALGRTRLDGLTRDEILRAKLDLGSFAALVGEARLPSLIADLAHGMLAEDPDHRPTPAMLLDPRSTRVRRLGSRQTRRASNPVRIGSHIAWTPRAAALAIATQPELGITALRDGGLDGWLRRGWGDPTLAARLDDAARLRPLGPETNGGEDALLAMRAIAILDPLAPLCWRGVSLWPDGIGAALAEAEAQPNGEAVGDALLELVSSEAVVGWAAQRPTRCDLSGLRVEARRQRLILGSGGGRRRSVRSRRLAYALNPLLACASPKLEEGCVARLQDLLPALEAAAASWGGETGAIIDLEIAAFLAGHTERSQDADLALTALGQGEVAALAELDVLARLQARWGGAVPALAGRIAADHKRLLTGWHGSAYRKRLATELAELAGAGQLAPMLALLSDPAARASDQAGARQAALRLTHIDAAIARLEKEGEAARAAARGIAQEVTAAMGLAAIGLALLGAVLG